MPRAIATGFLRLAVLVMMAAEPRAAAVLARLKPRVVAAARGINLRLFAWLASAGAGALTVAI